NLGRISTIVKPADAFEISTLVGKISRGAGILLVKFRGLDLRNDLPGFDLVALVDVYRLEIAGDLGIEHRGGSGTSVSEQLDRSLRRSGAGRDDLDPRSAVGHRPPGFANCGDVLVTHVVEIEHGQPGNHQSQDA